MEKVTFRMCGHEWKGFLKEERFWVAQGLGKEGA